jgi:hypothetical protein
MILPDRTQLLPSTETGGRLLENFNGELLGVVSGESTMSYETYAGPQRGELARLLLNHSDFELQLQKLQTLLARLGFSRVSLQAAQRAHFDDVAAVFQGSGLRALFPIVCALTDPALRLILIDEPEEALEPRLQKALRDLLIESATDCSILVSTHSHLFLNRRDQTANYRVSKAEGQVAVEALSSNEELYDVAFQLLGSSTEDLFFPANYLIVEGASDQIVMERVLALMDVPYGRIKVVAASGIDFAPDTVEALSRALLPVVMRDSPYAERVVALIDAPHDPETHTIKELRRILGDRLVTLDEPSLEEAIPEELYTRVEMTRDGVVGELRELKDDYRALQSAKRKISRQLAHAMEPADLDALPRFREAAERALAGTPPLADSSESAPD